MTMQATASGADLFLANVLSRPAGASSAPPPAGLCTVVRIDVALHDGQQPAMTSTTVIGSGFPWQQNKAALIQGPTGLALGRNGTLYVAETVTSSISRIPGAGTRATAVTAGTDTLTKGGSLNGPLGLTSVPGGDLVAVNGNDGNAVEVSPQGKQVATVTLVRNGAGDLFGIAPVADGHGLLFVNDGPTPWKCRPRSAPRSHLRQRSACGRVRPLRQRAGGCQSLSELTKPLTAGGQVQRQRPRPADPSC